MSLRFNNHKDPETITTEFKNLEETKQAKITMANRAPIKGDDGQFWYDWSGNKFYGRNQNTGDWQVV